MKRIDVILNGCAEPEEVLLSRLQAILVPFALGVCDKPIIYSGRMVESLKVGRSDDEIGFIIDEHLMASVNILEGTAKVLDSPWFQLSMEDAQSIRRLVSRIDKLREEEENKTKEDFTEALLRSIIKTMSECKN